MALINRSGGIELSELEKELVFQKKNTGFVEHITTDGMLFFLHPSPFFKSLRNEVFSAESCRPPAEHTFVEVDVESVEEKVVNTSDGFKRNFLKKINGWKAFEPDQYAKRKKLLDPYQVIQFFSHPFKGREDIIDKIATCSALYTFSSPPVIGSIGGINAAVLSKKAQWGAFKKPLKIIPDEFYLPSSQYFYLISDHEKANPSHQSEEVNLAFLRPEKCVMDIPIVIEDVTIRGLAGIKKEYVDEDQKMVTAYLLDSLLIKPNPMESVERLVKEAVYAIREEYLRSGISTYNQNLGDAIPKLTSSIARLQLDSKVKSDHVKIIVDLWRDMHTQTRYRMGSPLSIAKLYEISDDSRKLYTEIYDVFGKECPVPMQEVAKITSLKYDADFNQALTQLVERGYAIRDKKGITLLEKWS
jgi:hypothetical protein